MTAGDVIDAILSGEADDDFDEIITAIRTRQRQLRDSRSLVNRVTMPPGTRVRLRGLSPKYLNGLTGYVTVKQASRPKDLNVLLDEGQLTGRFGRSINVPASALEKVS